MFCSNCGNQLPDNTKFCSNCGTAVGSSAAPPTATDAPPAASKAPVNKLIPIIIGIAAFLVACFIIAPTISNSFKKDTDPADTSIPSISLPSSSQPSADSSQDTDYTYGKSKIKVFEAKSDGVLTSQFSFNYSDGKTALHEDDVVYSISGFVSVYDTSLAELNSIKQDTQTINQLIKQYGLDGMEITVNETDSYYTTRVSFTNLDGENRQNAAELAAQFIGISCDGTIKMSQAEKEMISFNYSLKDEY